MKKLLLVALLALSTLPAAAATKLVHTAGIGARLYNGHSVFVPEGGTNGLSDNPPFEDGDIAYTVAYECHETKNPIFWQLALGYASSLENDEVSDVFTPEFNLLVEEEHFRGGLGVLDSYVSYEEGDSDWTDVYYHFIFGMKYDMGNLTAALDALYAFSDWGELSDFEFDDIEYGLWLTYRFN